MALKIRLRKQGSNNRPFYRLVVTDIRTKRDGKYIENLGWYNPLADQDCNVELKADRIQHWLSVGALLSDNAATLVKRAAPAVMTEYHAKKQENKVKRKNRAA